MNVENNIEPENPAERHAFWGIRGAWTKLIITCVAAAIVIGAPVYYIFFILDDAEHPAEQFAQQTLEQDPQQAAQADFEAGKHRFYEIAGEGLPPLAGAVNLTPDAFPQFDYEPVRIYDADGTLNPRQEDIRDYVKTYNDAMYRNLLAGGLIQVGEQNKPAPREGEAAESPDGG